MIGAGVVRRAVLVGPGRIVVESIAPSAPASGELLVRPDAVGICGTDLELLDGSMAYITSGLTTYPLVPGHEWTGTVIALGPRVEGFVVGDRIVGECPIGCGTCELCFRGDYHLCRKRTETGVMQRDGALATEMVFPAALAHQLPSSVPPRDAALIEPLAVAYRGLKRLGVGENERLIIVGAGTIGLLCALVARALGITNIAIVDIDRDRLQFARSLGLSLAGERDRAENVIDTSGTPAGVAKALELCAHGGRVLGLGLTGTSVALDWDGIVLRDITVVGSLGSPGVWPEVISLVASGQVEPSQLVSHEFPLHEVAAAFELAARRESGLRKVLISPNSESH